MFYKWKLSKLKRNVQQHSIDRTQIFISSQKTNMTSIFPTKAMFWTPFVFISLISYHICKCQLLDIFRTGRRSGQQPVFRNEDPNLCIHDVPTTSIAFEDDSEFINCVQEVDRSRNVRHPDQYKRTNEVILAYGYNLVTYNNVTTADHYVLTLFRISGGQKSPPRKGKPAVLLFHGLGTASDQWVLQHGDRNLAFKLADAGYDVWLANSRGTDFSQRHLHLSAKDTAYWDFSFHEIGICDFPAILELMLSETGNKKIFYIGHSMGGTVLAVALSERPELNDKIEASILLAPALYIGHLYSPHRALSAILELGPQMQNVINKVLQGHTTSSDLPGLSLSRLCTPTALRCGVCGNAIFFLYGYDAPQINFTNVPNILSKISNMASFKSLLHFGQNFRSCMFRKYDYGPVENQRRYSGNTQPPSYDISRVTVPTYIYYGDADNFVPPVDVIATRDALPPGTVKGFFRVNWKFFNHVDFMIAKDADLLVYNSVLDVLNGYTKGFR